MSRQLYQVLAAKKLKFLFSSTSFPSHEILAPDIKTDHGSRSPTSEASFGTILKFEYLDENKAPESAVAKTGEHMEVLQSSDNHFPACWLPKTEPLGQLMNSHV